MRVFLSAIRLTILGLIALTSVVAADFQNATNTGQSPTDDYMVTQCHYRTLGGFEFSVNARGICPFSVQVDPRTMEVKTGGAGYQAPPRQQRWETATNTGQQPTGDPMITQCFYQTVGGYKFSTNARGLCPFSVQVNTQTNEVRAGSSYGGQSAASQPRWQSATNTGQSPTGDAMITECHYRTLGGFEFSTNQRGICAFQVQVDPVSGQVKLR